MKKRNRKNVQSVVLKTVSAVLEKIGIYDADVEIEANRVIAQLREGVTDSPQGLRFHLVDPKTGRSLDFLTMQERKMAELHSEAKKKK